MSKAECFVYLADAPAKQQILTVFCKVDGFTKESARDNIKNILDHQHKLESYSLHYLGVINYQDLDQDVLEKQDAFFQKYDSVWLLNCSYIPR